MKKIFILLLVITGCTPRLFPQKSFTLKDLLELAHANSLMIKISRKEKEIAVENYRNQKKLGNPGIEYSRGTGEMYDAPRKRTLWEFGIHIPLPNPLTRHYLLKKQKNLVAVSQLEQIIREREITRLVKHHYYNIQLGERLKKYLTEQIKNLDDVCRITRNRVRLGEAVELDHLRTITEKQLKKTQLFKIEKSIASEKNKINEILDFSMPSQYLLIQDFDFTPLGNIKKNLDQDIQENIWVKVRESRLDSRKNQLQASRSSIFESIELFARRGNEMDAKIWKFGVGISIPLFRKGSDSRLNRLKMEKARLEWEHAKKHLLSDIYRKLSHIRILESEISTFNDTILTLGQKSVALSKTMYQSGEISLINHLDVQNSFFNTMARYYQAISEWKALKAELATLLGEEL